MFPFCLGGPVGVFSRRLKVQAAIVKISGEFPHLLQVRTGEKRRRSEEAMNFTFISYWSESHWGSPAYM